MAASHVPKIATPTLVHALGEYQCWGFSPAVSLTATASLRDPLPSVAALTGHPNTVATVSAPDTPIGRAMEHFLLLGASDARHVIATIAAAATPSTAQPAAAAPLHFYAQDESLDAAGRHMLLLTVLMDQSLSRHVRMEMFCELYGNVLLRVKTYEYLLPKLDALLQFVSECNEMDDDDEAAAEAAANKPGAAPLTEQQRWVLLYRRVFDVRSFLKFKERDELCAILRFWRVNAASLASLSANTPATLAAAPGATGATAKQGVTADAKGKASALASAASAGGSDNGSGSGSSGGGKVVGRIGTADAPEPFDIETLRDHRLRHYYGDRFDSRANLYDWDYFMCLKEVGLSIVHVQQYKRWRHFGQAFELRDADYTVPNRTLAGMREGRQRTPNTHNTSAGVRRGGGGAGGPSGVGSVAVRVRGYWSDIVVSPYIAWGVRATEPALFEVVNDQHTRSAVDVCAHNILDALSRLELATPWHDPNLTPVASAPPKPDAKPNANSDDAAPPKPVAAADDSKSSAAAGAGAGAGATAFPASGWSRAPKWRLHILSPEIGADKELKLYGKSKFAGLFDRAFVGQAFAHYLNLKPAAATATAAAAADAKTPAPAQGTAPASGTGAAAASTPHAAHPFRSVLRSGAIVTVELPKYLPLKAEQKAGFAMHVLTRTACADAPFVLYPPLATPSGAAATSGPIGLAPAATVEALSDALRWSAFVSFEVPKA